MECRKQFTFYVSYYEAVKELKPAEQTKVILSICEYALNGKEIKLSGVPAAIFALIKPTLDAGARKAANRKNKTRTNQEQNDKTEEQNSKEKEKELEKELEKECECEEEGEREVDHECVNACGAENQNENKTVIDAFQAKLGSLLSDTAVHELVNDFIPRLGTDVTLHALDAALNAGKREWNYIRAILKRYTAAGYTTLEQLADAENARAAARSQAAARQSGVKGSKAHELDEFYAMAQRWAGT